MGGGGAVGTQGERGVVAKGLDDKREVGVKLKGYTGTGTFHVTEVKREAKAAAPAKPKQRPIKRNMYG